MPADVKREAEMRKREELEQTQEADTKKPGHHGYAQDRIPTGLSPARCTPTDAGKPPVTDIKPAEIKTDLGKTDGR